MYRQIVVLCAIMFAVAAATDLKQCKRGALPLSVDVKGCEKQPCDIVKGSTAVMDVHFVGTKNNIRRMTTKVRATALGITVPYELPADVADVCSNLLYGASCPIYKDEDVVYRFNFYVDSTYPEIGVKVEITIMDESNEPVTCFIVDIKVRKGATNPLEIEAL